MSRVYIPHIAVVIPAYNESDRIESTLKRCVQYLETLGCKWSILVVDDGSKDDTIQKVLCLKINFPQIDILKVSENRGKGNAVRMGMLVAEADWILFSDADLATPIEEFKKLADFLNEGYDIVFGSRPLKESQLLVHQPFYREFLGRIFNRFVQLLTLPGVHDTQCGFKLFKANVAKHLFSESQVNGFIFDVEILCLAKFFGYSFKEVPVKWAHQEGSKVKVIRHGAEAFFELIKLRLKMIKLTSNKLIKKTNLNNAL